MKKIYDFKEIVDNANEFDLLRIQYCYHLGCAFISMNLLEDEIIGYLALFTEVPIKSDASKNAGFELVEKYKLLQNSTLGNLLRIFEKNGATKEDLKGLTWLKGQRDYFVHKYLKVGGLWPGDLPDFALNTYIRQVMYFDLVFKISARRLPKFLNKIGRAEIEEFSDGILLMPKDFWDKF